MRNEERGQWLDGWVGPMLVGASGISILMRNDAMAEFDVDMQNWGNSSARLTDASLGPIRPEKSDSAYCMRVSE